MERHTLATPYLRLALLSLFLCLATSAQAVTTELASTYVSTGATEQELTTLQTETTTTTATGDSTRFVLFNAVVNNPSSANVNVTLRVALDGATASSATISVPPGSATTIQLPFTQSGLTVGSHTWEAFVTPVTSVGVRFVAPDTYLGVYGLEVIAGGGSSDGAVNTIQVSDGSSGFDAYAGATCSAGQHASALSALGALTCSAFPPVSVPYLVTTADSTLSAEVVLTPTDDRAIVANGTTWEIKAVPDCDDTSGQHLNYDTGTNAFSCGTTGGAGGSAPSDATYLTATSNGSLSAEVVVTPTDDNAIVANGPTWEIKALPNCTDTGGNHLNYTAATNAFSCGTSDSGAAASITSGTTTITSGTDTSPCFQDGASPGGTINCADTGWSFNETTNALTATTFIGALTGNADTATALAANPTDCAATQFATTIAANGNLTCAAPSYVSQWMGRVHGTLSSTTTYYSAMQGSDKIVSGAQTEVDFRQVVAVPGTVSTLHCVTNTAPSAGKSWAIMARLNAGNTTLTCTISDANTTCSDTSNSFAVVAGDLVNLRFTPASTPTTTEGIACSVKFAT